MKEELLKQWTWLTYMVVDHATDVVAVSDLRDMKGVGSTPDLNLVTQITYDSSRPSLRYFLRRGGSLDSDVVDPVAADLTEKDSSNSIDPGGPADSGEESSAGVYGLKEFINWGLSNYPARRYVIDIWSPVTLFDGRTPAAAPGSRWPIFEVGADSRFDREVAYGNSAKDFADIVGLADALASVSGSVLERYGVRLDILHVAGCRIGLAEAGYQIRGDVELLIDVGDRAPLADRRYGEILKRLARSSELSSSELANLIVTTPTTPKGKSRLGSRSACDLAAAEELAQAMRELSAVLMRHLYDPEARAAIVVSRFSSAIEGRLDEADLYRFCRELKKAYRGGEILHACDSVLAAINHRGYLLSHTPTSEGKRLTIYFPQRQVLPAYNQLDFSKATGWGDFLQQYVAATRAEEEATTESTREGDADVPLGTAADAEPVMLGAAAPQAAAPGSQFTARFVAYVKTLEEETSDILKNLSPRSTPHLNLKSCRWRPGIHVTIRLSAKHLIISPAEEEFIWDGGRSLVEFDVEVPQEVKATETILKFDVIVGGFKVAGLRVNLEVRTDATAGRINFVKSEPARTAFASYASQDRLRVLDRISEIVRNGVDVYLDCLSLHPGEEWKPRLEREIRERDVFILFWSAHAKKSRWVRWEWKTALRNKDLSTVEPHPLDSVAVAEPPKELRELHFGDPLMLIRKAYEDATE